jgi:hypothetical protein
MTQMREPIHRSSIGRLGRRREQVGWASALEMNAKDHAVAEFPPARSRAPWVGLNKAAP